MEWTFVLKDKGSVNQGWWLKLSSLEEVIRYHETKFTDICANGYKSLMNSKEFGHGEMHANDVAILLGTMSENLKIPVSEVLERLSGETLWGMFTAIKDGKTIYVNRKGGWHAGIQDYSDWIRKDVLEFPMFTKDRICIKKFPYGSHYYAYVDGNQVRNGDQIKWNTYEEAYSYAKSLTRK